MLENETPQAGEKAEKAKITLDWGETPWDELSRDELLRQVQMMYSAVRSAGTALALCSHGEQRGFWSPEGTGGRALAKVAAVEAPLSEYEGGADAAYGGFYRYADDLLFPDLPREPGKWCICPECGSMWAGPEARAGAACDDILPDCPGILRLLTWDDLEPHENADDGDDLQEI